MTRIADLVGRYLAIALLAMVLPACTHLFYQPQRVGFYNPADFGLANEDILFESADGRKLNGWYFPPAGGVEGKGIIVQFHGNAENISTHFLSLAWVVKHGYGLFTFDYSGYGASEGAPSQQALNEDALAALTYAEGRLQSLNPAGSKKVLVAYGQSLGGAVLLRALADFPRRDAIDTVVIESSFASYKAIASDKLSLRWFTWPLQPLAYLLVSDAYAPEEVIPSLAGTRLLVIHGNDDAVVPIRFGKRIFELAGEPKTFWEVPHGHHIDSMTAHADEYRGKLIAFIEHR